MKIATVSLDQVWEDKKSNILLCEEYIKKASQENVDLIIFPEMTLTGFSINIVEIFENEDGSETVSLFQRLAKENEIAVIFGMVVKDSDKALNKSLFIEDKGILLDRYAKIHPFSFSGEDKYFNGGDSLTVVRYKDFNIGLTICYDLRFPELYSALAKTSDLIINIANWPKKRVDHWNTLLKARAIENQIYVVAVNRTGIDGNNLEYEESSNIYNANGEVLKYDVHKDMKIYEVDKTFTTEFTNTFNTTNDRKIELYKEII